MAPRFGDPVTLEVAGREVRVSNPEKPYFPVAGLSKLDVVSYYRDVSPWMLPLILDRPTTLERWPSGVVDGVTLAQRDGTKGEAFYQKRVPAGAPPWVRTARISFPSGRTADEVCPSEEAVLVWAAQLGTITFHPWPVRSTDVESPDELRIDLDPQPGSDFADAVRVAGEARAVLDQLGWVGYPKTSGGRGVHVYVRIAAALDLHRRAARRHRVRPGARAADARQGHDRLVEGGASGRAPCSSTTTRTPGTVPSPPPTRSEPGRTRRCRPRCGGRSSPTSTRAT